MKLKLKLGFSNAFECWFTMKPSSDIFKTNIFWKVLVTDKRIIWNICGAWHHRSIITFTTVLWWCIYRCLDRDTGVCTLTESLCMTCHVFNQVGFFSEAFSTLFTNMIKFWDIFYKLFLFMAAVRHCFFWRGPNLLFDFTKLGGGIFMVLWFNGFFSTSITLITLTTGSMTSGCRKVFVSLHRIPFWNCIIMFCNLRISSSFGSFSLFIFYAWTSSILASGSLVFLAGGNFVTDSYLSRI